MNVQQFFMVLFLGIIAFGSCTLQSMYFWEACNDGGRSCCLSYMGSDICNPYVPCTRHVRTDLTGISDYITRLLQAEKSSQFSYFQLLNQAQMFIRHTLISGQMSIYYHFDEHRSVQFFHELQQSEKSKSDNKSSDKSSKVSLGSSGNALSDKQKSEEAVLAYLVAKGAARKIK